MSKTVLIVEDDPGVQTLLEIALERNGYEVWKAPDAQAALIVLEERRPDLILSDDMMPGMDGYDFCRLVRAREATRHTPFVMMSARSPKESEPKSIEAGANELFIKPSSLDDLLTKIASQLNP